MAVTSCRLKAQTGDFGLENNNQFDLVYLVETSGIESVPSIKSQLHTATPDPVPQIYQHVGEGAYVLNIHVEGRVVDSRTHWTVTVRCGQVPPGKDLQALNQPDYLTTAVNRWPVFRVEHETETEPILKNANGTPILNTARKRFDEPLFQEKLVPILVITRNVIGWTDVLTINEKMRNTSSSLAIGPIFGKTFPAGTFQFQSATAGDPIIESNIQYYRTDIRLRMGDLTRQVLNRGYEHYDVPGAGKKLVKATNEGQPVSEPVLLQNDGTRLPDGSDPTYVTVTPYTPKDYSMLFMNAPLDPDALP